jgi:hypothetical protein
LTRAAKAGDLELAVAEALGLPASTSTDDLINQVVRLQKLAEANGRNARYWGDEYEALDRASRQALGEHHKPGHTLPELITTLVGRVDRLTSERNEAQGALTAAPAETGGAE